MGKFKKWVADKMTHYLKKNGYWPTVRYIERRNFQRCQAQYMYDEIERRRVIEIIGQKHWDEELTERLTTQIMKDLIERGLVTLEHLDTVNGQHVAQVSLYVGSPDIMEIVTEPLTDD